MNRDPRTEKTVTRLQLTVEELKKALRDVMWERSAILGPPLQRADWPEIFVLMPFKAALRPVYEVHIKRSVARLRMRIGRADAIFGTDQIMREVWSAIHAARIIIADCTGRNPNVFYEIGLAHAVGKHTILIARSLKDVPFDLRTLRVILYNPSGMRAFERRLCETIKKCGS